MATRDAACYVWDFWWMAHSVEHFNFPWSTTYLAAPGGTQFGLHALMPLLGVVMMPVTVLFGPSASFNLVSIALPGLLAYAMYRVARLWLQSQIAAIAAGAFFGFSAIVDLWAWIHLNLAAGALFVPLALEAAVRMRRRPGPRQAVTLGLVLGAGVLVDQDSAVMAAILAGAAVVPWLVGRPVPGDPADDSIAARTLRARRWRRLLPTALAGATTAVVASPQLVAIADEAKVGGPVKPTAATSYLHGAGLPSFFEPSPRVTDFGLHIPHAAGFFTYGTVLSVLAVAGLILSWRQRRAWWLAGAWLGATLLALGSDVHFSGHAYLLVPQVWHGARLSSVMPFTWLVRTPGLATFRFPYRIGVVGLVPAAVLAGFAVNWFRQHAKPAMIAVFAIAVLEAGISRVPGESSMPTALPAVERPIAADRSASIVVDVPFGIRGGIGIIGQPFAPEALVLATFDGHPVAEANLSRIPTTTDLSIRSEPFYAGLMRTQNGHNVSRPNLKAAAMNARSMDVGWVRLWTPNPLLQHYLLATGFRFDYRAQGVSVYRLALAGGPST
ncbi:MAG TPA: hypothetical protein VFQ44_20335 [Streptosporangiaceae bacterium]|nr:hypothetical protein [Streptosporangiaceae bacterium]